LNVIFKKATERMNVFSAPVLLIENDIPGASLGGRKPAELKKKILSSGYDVEEILVKVFT